MIEELPSNKWEEIIEKKLKLKEKEIQTIFSKNGAFSGAGSEGLQNKLYNHLKQKLDI